jgi:hypothetical protein
VTVSIRIDKLQAEKVEGYSSTEGMFFDVKAKLEERNKSNNVVTLGFNLDISTKPNVVKYTIAGSVTLEGSTADIKKKLEVNPKTQIPQILFTVYQHVFNSIYLLGSVLDTPYPPPDLLHPMAEKIQIIASDSGSKAEPDNRSPLQPQTEQQVVSSNNAPSTLPAAKE